MKTLLSRRKRRPSFTLVELLIVIVVIAMLVAFLLPALKIARDRAKQIACANNLKQLGLGVTGYVGDNNDYIFPVSQPYGSSPSIAWFTFFGYYQNYISSSFETQYKIMQCPVPKYPINWYGMNYNTFWTWRKINQLKWPSSLILFADSKPSYLCGGIDDPAYVYRIAPTAINQAAYLGTAAFRHIKNCNVLWADSSVSARSDGHIPGDYPGVLFRAAYTSEWSYNDNRYDSSFVH